SAGGAPGAAALQQWPAPPAAAAPRVSSCAWGFLLRRQAPPFDVPRYPATASAASGFRGRPASCYVPRRTGPSARASQEPDAIPASAIKGRTSRRNLHIIRFSRVEEARESHYPAGRQGDSPAPPHPRHTEAAAAGRGKPVMSYILDDLRELGVSEIVFITGHLKEKIEEYVRTAYPEFTSHFVEQKVQDGTAGAVRLARPYIDEDVLIIFVDTIFDADLSLVQRLPEDLAGVIWAKEVEDYQRFGVIVTDSDGNMKRIVEEPKDPISKLANIGLYYIRDHALLFEGIENTCKGPRGPGAEYYLTDAFQYMIDRGAKIRVEPVEGWYDAGQVDTLLETNRHLLEN